MEMLKLPTGAQTSAVSEHFNFYCLGANFQPPFTVWIGVLNTSPGGRSRPMRLTNTCSEDSDNPVDAILPVAGAAAALFILLMILVI